MTFFSGIFMFIANALLPVLWMFFGNYHRNHIPKEISSNGAMYRVKGATKNKDTWVFAHNFWGDLSKKVGTALLVINAIPLVFIFAKSSTIVFSLNMILIAVNILVYLCSYHYMISKLKQVFDEHGNRRK